MKVLGKTRKFTVKKLHFFSDILSFDLAFPDPFEYCIGFMVVPDQGSSSSDISPRTAAQKHQHLAI